MAKGFRLKRQKQMICNTFHNNSLPLELQFQKNTSCLLILQCVYFCL